MSREDTLKVQTLELKVNIHCDGCLKKVKKVLHKIDGVYQSTVNAAEGKVTVSGLMDPDTVIRKLHKAGKPAQLWGATAKPAVATQLEKLQLKDAGGKGQGQPPKNAGGKGQPPKNAAGKGQGQGQKQQQPKGGAGGAGAGAKVVALPHSQPTPQQLMQMQQQMQMNGMKFAHPELMAMGAGRMPMPMPFPAAAQAQAQAAAAKDPKTVKFDLPGGEEFGDDGSDLDDEFDELDDVDFEDDGLDAAACGHDDEAAEHDGRRGRFPRHGPDGRPPPHGWRRHAAGRRGRRARHAGWWQHQHGRWRNAWGRVLSARRWRRHAGRRGDAGHVAAASAAAAAHGGGDAAAAAAHGCDHAAAAATDDDDERARPRPRPPWPRRVRVRAPGDAAVPAAAGVLLPDAAAPPARQHVQRREPQRVLGDVRRGAAAACGGLRRK
uniref:HMA domain-containing protein n=1 Tax=Zea mays TaxID=4577 RepID=C4J0W4_MAIZE|nr:unknown [Zea mays]